MSPEKKYDVETLGELILLMFDDRIDEEGLRHLERQLVCNPEAMDYYHDFLITYLGVQDGQFSASPLPQPDFSVAECNDLLLQMVEYEKNAPAVKLEKPVNLQEPIRKVVYEDAKFFTLKRSSLASFGAMAAVVLFLILFARFAPPKSGVKVATLTDSLHAQWTDSNASMQNGTRLSAGYSHYELQDGYVTFLFDNKTVVTVEGPAQFQILTGDQIALDYGKIYAVVPPEVYGFQVSTPAAKIIDLGTEFGVYQDRNGKTELHVITGKTSLVSGIGGARINAYVEAGVARRIYGDTGRLEVIRCDSRLFARTIDSRLNRVWRGSEPPYRLDLSLLGAWQRVDGFEGDERIGSLDRQAADGVFAASWDTEINNSQLVLVVREAMGQSLRMRSLADGAGRGAAFTGVSDPIENGRMGGLFFRFMVESGAGRPRFWAGLGAPARNDPMNAKVVGDPGAFIAAGFAAVDDGNEGFDLTTTDGQTVVKAGLVRDQWYDAWIVVENATKTFDLYITEAAGPLVAPVPLMGAAVRFGAVVNLPFGSDIDVPLTGAMFMCPTGEDLSAYVFVDEIHWAVEKIESIQ